MTLVSADGEIGERQPAPLAAADHSLDGVAEEPARRSSISKFARPLEVFPGDLERSWESESSSAETT